MIFSVNVADKNLVEQTTNHFYARAKFEQKRPDDNLVEELQADCFEKFQKDVTVNSDLDRRIQKCCFREGRFEISR